ncbi:MAG: hypothetical protein KME25_10695 [Symplocastrum torsivum CPER-KK1]|jgi:hypothetical protein|uniref:Uncharacterized protein n=1 Tax=Symplocastrum torsivum CPER-KK1 TaxID=450513 RepID=A0A951PJ34_9CYAN|nr:hypothetical protein [Symplocastrum torsivum CPER-KK1]
MSKQLLSVVMTLPMVIVGVGLHFANIPLNNLVNLQFTRQSARISQVTLDSQASSPILQAARDEQNKECQLLGICDDSSS